MIGMNIKRISVLNLCHVLKPFVKSTPGALGNCHMPGHMFPYNNDLVYTADEGVQGENTYSSGYEHFIAADTPRL